MRVKILRRSADAIKAMEMHRCQTLDMSLSERQFEELRTLVYHACGINLHSGKRQLLQARLSRRLRRTGIKSVQEYLDLLEKDQEELIHFVDAVSTNHTLFFRESHHFQVLNSSHRNIWCAACSSGEEPYSVAIDCLEKGFRPSILATDISTKVLDTARSGIYPRERTRMMPRHLLRRYFQKGQGQWEDFIRVKEEVRRMVTFGRFNLVTDPLPSRKFDVIFCRNVLIYFDSRVKEQVINRLYGLLKGHGYFIIGGAESLSNLRNGFKYIRPSIYRKRGSPGSFD